MTESRTVQKDREESRLELGLGMISRDYGSLGCTHGAHMVTEIKRV